MDSNTPFKRNIKNIVYVMFENRSFDNLLGWLYDGNANPCHVHNIPANHDPKPKFMGLTLELLQEFKQPLKGLFNIGSTTYHPIVRGVQGNLLPSSTPIADPHEEFQYITQQIYQTPLNHAPTKKDKRTMLGFLQSYHDARTRPNLECTTGLRSSGRGRRVVTDGRVGCGRICRFCSRPQRLR